MSETSDRSRILVVDDDDPTRMLLRELLTMEGYAVDEAADGATALAKVATFAPDLLLLDVMMPGRDGFDVLTSLRRTSDVPVILLSAKAHENDRVVGLRLGADDYVVKPFSGAELVARIAGVLRRTTTGRAPARLEFDGLEIDLVSRAVSVRGEPIDIPAREYELLVFMASSPRHLFSREDLLEAVWGSSSGRQRATTVTEHVRRIRQRIEVDPDRPRWILTVRGMGYRFDP
jgi:DNA-binding response OmpR family regulator